MNPLRHLRNRKLLAALAARRGAAGRRPLAARPVPVDVATVDRGPLRVTRRRGGRDARARSLRGLGARSPAACCASSWSPATAVDARHGRGHVPAGRRRAPRRARARRGARPRCAAARAALGRPGPSASARRPRSRSPRSELAAAPRRSPSSGVVSRQALEARETEARAAEEALRAAEFAVATRRHQLEMARGAAAAGRRAPARRAPLVLRSPDRRRRPQAPARERGGRARRASRCSSSATRAASRSSPTCSPPTR